MGKMLCAAVDMATDMRDANATEQLDHMHIHAFIYLAKDIDINLDK